MAKSLLCFLMAVLEISCVLYAQEYVIDRRADSYELKKGIWKIKPDWFTITPLQCVDDGSKQCSDMGGRKRRRVNCSCACNANTKNVYIKSTFGFYDNQWKCYENDKVRTHGECSNVLDDDRNRNYNSSLLTGPSNVEFYVPGLTEQCTIARGKFLKCNGKWEQAKSSTVNAWFFLDGYYLRFKNPLPAHPNLRGRVIRLDITCSGDSVLSESTTQCLLIKVKGKMTCSHPLRTSSLIMESTIGSSLQPSSTLSGSSTPAAEVSTSVEHPQIPTSFIQPISSTMPISLSLPTPTSSLTPLSASSSLGIQYTRQTLDPSESSTEPTLTTSSEISKSRKKSARSDDNKSSLIIGVLAGVVGLAVMIIVIVIMKRRKKRDAVSKNRMVVENAGYGRGQDNSLRFNGQQAPDEDEYSYAYNNAAPFVKTNKQDMENYTNNDHEPKSSVANQVYGNTEELNHIGPAPYNEAPVYNTLEEAVYAKVDKSRKENPSNSDAPIYNTLEEPEYANVDKSQKTRLSENHKEPLYNVLEGPEIEEGLSEEPPCYQVLEEPFSEGAPVYDVLEGPESDEAPVYDVLEGPESDEAPVYGVLEGQDPHVYGTLDMPDIQGSPEENRGYDDMVYDSVGDVINDQGDIYQELNQSGQPNSDVYQTLNYPGKTMYLNELNQTRSSA